MLSIVLSSLTDDEGTAIGDADLYVTNRFGGLVAASKENYVWKSVNAGTDRLNIMGTADNTHNVYIIGVSGNKDSNNFEIVAFTSDPAPITNVTSDTNLSVDFESTKKYKFFSLPVDPRSQQTITIQVTTKANNTSARDMVNTDYGRGVYTKDTIPVQMIFPPVQLMGPALGRKLSVDLALDGEQQGQGVEWQLSSPENGNLIPVVFLSMHNFPTADNYMWKVRLDSVSDLPLDITAFPFPANLVHG